MNASGERESGGEPRKSGGRRKARPLDQARLEELALRYVSRFATTRAKLSSYLVRKVRERGWDGERDADVAAIAERFAGLGYVDDAAFARSRAGSLSARGYGARRVGQALSQAGVSKEDSGEALEMAGAAALDSALRFARKRRLGPFGDGATDPAARQKAIAAMIRAGHGFELARRIVDAPPGSEFEAEIGNSL